MLMDSAAQLTVSDVSILREREYLTVEESQMLLLRMIDEEYGEL